jgi:DNA invertase Pin-like site-specific DNA recombinase
MKRHSNCPWCKQELPSGFYEEKAQHKANRIKRILKARKDAGLHVGRPQEHDYAKILSFRSKGWSMRKIAREIGCSTFTVQRAVGFPSRRR